MGFHDEICFRDKHLSLTKRLISSRINRYRVTLRYAARGVMATVTAGPIFNAYEPANTGGRVKCGHFLQEFCAGAQEYDVLFTEALVADVRRDLASEDSLASVAPGSPEFSRSLRKLLGPTLINCPRRKEAPVERAMRVICNYKEGIFVRYIDLRLPG